MRMYRKSLEEFYLYRQILFPDAFDYTTQVNEAWIKANPEKVNKRKTLEWLFICLV